MWEFDPDGTGDRQKMVRAYFNGRLFTSTGDAAAGSHTVYTDHLGTPRLKLHVMTAASEARDDYYPFGQQVNTVVDAAHDRRFTGKERDAESGLDYFGARYYHSVAGRFLSVDPSRESLAIKNPQSLNRYTYVLNSPLKLKDPDGKAAVLATLAIGAGTDVGLQVALNVLQGDAWHKDVGTAVVTGAVAGGTGFGLVKIAQKAIKVVKAYRAARAAGQGANTVRKGAEAVDGATFHRISGGGSAIPKSVDDLLQRAVESKPLARPGRSQVTVKGNNPKEIFKSLARNATEIGEDTFKLKDGTVIHFHHSTKTGLSTI